LTQGEDIPKEITAVDYKGEKGQIFRQPREQHHDLELAASTSAQQSQNPVQHDHVNMATPVPRT